MLLATLRPLDPLVVCAALFAAAACCWTVPLCCALAAGARDQTHVCHGVARDPPAVAGVALQVYRYM
jgi:hypothetical protein